MENNGLYSPVIQKVFNEIKNFPQSFDYTFDLEKQFTQVFDNDKLKEFNENWNKMGVFKYLEKYVMEGNNGQKIINEIEIAHYDRNTALMSKMETIKLYNFHELSILVTYPNRKLKEIKETYLKGGLHRGNTSTKYFNILYQVYFLKGLEVFQNNFEDHNLLINDPKFARQLYKWYENSGGGKWGFKGWRVPRMNSDFYFILERSFIAELGYIAGLRYGFERISAGYSLYFPEDVKTLKAQIQNELNNCGNNTQLKTIVLIFIEKCKKEDKGWPKKKEVLKYASEIGYENPHSFYSTYCNLIKQCQFK